MYETGTRTKLVFITGAGQMRIQMMSVAFCSAPEVWNGYALLDLQWFVYFITLPYASAVLMTELCFDILVFQANQDQGKPRLVEQFMILVGRRHTKAQSRKLVNIFFEIRLLSNPNLVPG